MERYREFVAEGKNQPSPWEQLRNQIYLGSDAFIKRLQVQLDAGRELSDVPVKQRRALPKALSHYAARFKERDMAIAAAYGSGGYSMKEIGDHFSLHYSYISRIIRRIEKARG
jgi:hypothetical protein